MSRALKKEADRLRVSPVRRVFGDILIVLVAAFTVYLCVIMTNRINTVVLKDTYRKIFKNELILCGILLLFSLDLRSGFLTRLRPAALRIAGWIPRIVLMALSGVILFFAGRVICGGLINTAGAAENAIVLGMALQDGEPTKDLIFRLDAAEQYLEEYPEATLILTGGNADEAGLTEAGLMRKLLLARGLPEEKMVLEDKAESTEDNFANSARILDPAEPVVLISSGYHMDRAVRTAGKAGFVNCMRRPARSDPLQYGANVMWEVILEINDWISGK